MSADTPTEPTPGERMARGELSLADHITECRFCGAGRAALHRRSHTEHADQYSHRGSVIESIKCDECGGALYTRTYEQTRVNLPSRATIDSQWWDIPEGYALIICDDCDGPVGPGLETIEENKPLFDAIYNGDKPTMCCDASATFEFHRHDLVGGDGQ